MAQLYCSTADIGRGWLGHNTVYATVSPEVLHTVGGGEGRAGGWGGGGVETAEVGDST